MKMENKMINKESEEYKIFINQVTRRILANPLVLNYIESVVAEYDIEFEEAKKDILEILKNHDKQIAEICLAKKIIDFKETLPLYFEANCGNVIETLSINMTRMLSEIVEGEEKKAKVLYVKESEPPIEEHNEEEYVQDMFLINILINIVITNFTSYFSSRRIIFKTFY